MTALDRLKNTLAAAEESGREVFPISDDLARELITDITRLQRFRDDVYAAIFEHKGNLGNEYAYMWHRQWDRIKAAEKGEP